MLYNWLKEYKNPTAEALNEGVNSILEPFASLPKEAQYMTGKEATDYLQNINGNFNELPPIITFQIDASPTCIIQEFAKTEVIWFFCELKKTLKGRPLWVIRNWEYIASGYCLNEYGTIVDFTYYMIASSEGVKPTASDILKAASRINDKGKRYTVSEVCEILGVSKATVHDKLIKQHLLTAYKDGDKTAPYFISEYHLKEYQQCAQWERMNKMSPLKLVESYDLSVFS